MDDIRCLFEPRSVAVVGASRNSKKIGYTVVNNIISNGYKGKVYPVNPSGGKLLGLTVYKNIEEIEDDVDVVCTIVPAKYVFESVQSCVRKGVKYNFIISSGFSEVGNIEEEKKIASYSREHGMRIIGPNIFGVYSAEVSLDATFGPGNILPGSVAIVTQSGALGLAMIGKTKVENLGLSTIVSVGNKCDIDEADLLEYLTFQERTKVILMYIEGIKNGEQFIRAVKKATQRKPVVVIKSGRSARGAVAAASHTGSLAGSDEIVDAILKQYGVIRADSIKDAFNWCKFLSNSPPPPNENAVIITNGGGIGVMATDACEQCEISLYDDDEVLKELFSTVTPSFGSTKNPVDITGGAASVEFDTALGVALDHDEIGACLVLYCETAVFDAKDLQKVLGDNYIKYKKRGKPVLFVTVGGEDIEKCVVALGRRNVPVFGDVYEAVSCLGNLYAYQRYLKVRSDDYEDAEINVSAIDEICFNAINQNRYFLLAHEAQKIMEIIGIPIPKSYIARNLNEAVGYAEKIGFPVVMKIVSKDIIHKSDAGGIALDLEDKEEVIDAYQVIIQNCREYNPDARIFGVEIAEMLQKDIETVVGARWDTTFGSVLMFGLGGIYIEVIKDVAFRSLPLGRREIMNMIKETKSYPLLLGVRGQEKKDMESVINVVIKIGALIQKCKTISDVEINPLMVYEQGMGAKAIDVRILLSKNERR